LCLYNLMRKILGYTMLVISCLAWAVIVFLPFLNSSPTTIATFAAGLIITGEVTFFLGVALLGKEVWEKIKGVFKIRKKHDTKDSPKQI